MTDVKETRAEKNARLEQERLSAAIDKNIGLLAKNAPRLLRLMGSAQAGDYCHCVSIKHGNMDPYDAHKPDVQNFSVVFMFFRRPDRDYEDEMTLSLFGDEWEYEQVERMFLEIDDMRKAEQERRELARKTYDELSQAQRDALGLKFRP